MKEDINNVIYCFSGTGNSMNAAIKVANAIKKTTIISMRCDPKDVSAENADNIGFIFPVYHWSLPEAAARFIQKVEINKKAYIFCIATCGGWPVNALNDFADLMRNKGLNVSYSRVHYTVANYVVEYEPFPNPKKKIPIATIELENIAHDISEKVTNKTPKASFRKELLRLLEKPFVKALPQKDRHFIVSDHCIACGLCEKICIVKNITLTNGKPVFHNECAQCMGCIAYCPKGAINYRNKTQKRTKYHHPNVSANMLVIDKMVIE